MTFNPNVPNASQSPGLFPPQNNTNMARLKALFNNDHVFNDTAYAGPNLPGTDGCHRQVTMITVPTVPVVLPNGTNSILYTNLDSLSRAQLYFFNGLTTVQLTPPDELWPISVTGTITVPKTSSATIYADPGFKYAGTVIGTLNTAVLAWNYFSIIRRGNNVAARIIHSNISNEPSFSYSGDDLQINNPNSGAATFIYSLIINRIP